MVWRLGLVVLSSHLVVLSSHLTRHEVTINIIRIVKELLAYAGCCVSEPFQLCTTLSYTRHTVKSINILFRLG